MSAGKYIFGALICLVFFVLIVDGIKRIVQAIKDRVADAKEKKAKKAQGEQPAAAVNEVVDPLHDDDLDK